MIVVVYMFFASLGLSVVAVLAATIATERHWQTMWSAAVVVGLVLLFFFAVGVGVNGLERERIAYDSPEFWYANVGMALAYGSYFAMFFLAAAAQLTFPSENRSTLLRIVMLVQHLLLVFGMAWAFARQQTSGGGSPPVLQIPSVFIVILTLHWYLMGTFLIGEVSQLSNRAKRRLPQSSLGRAFFTWFNPGSASGFVFAVANLASGLALNFTAIAVWRASRTSMQGATWGPSVSYMQATAYISLLAFGYAAFYLGLGKFLLGLLRRIATVGMLFCVLIQLLLLAIGSLSPIIIDEMAGNRFQEYSFWHIYSPIHTFSALGRQLMTGSIDAVILFILGSALAMFFLNLRGIARELRQVRAEAPRRVIEEEEALHPKPVVAPINPFE
jgi:hypothetical protein